MTLVTYSDSESEDDGPITITNSQASPKAGPPKRKIDDLSDNDTKPVQRQKPPPLPSTFRSLYATNVRTSASDDPTLHGGRKRQIPHVEGQWPTHVYLEWMPSTADRTFLDNLIIQAQSRLLKTQTITPFYRSPLGVQQPLHISLSAPLTLITANKDEFSSILVDRLSKTRTQPFQVKFKSLEWVSNFDVTRYFLIIRLERTEMKELEKLVGACNDVCKAFGLPVLYQDGMQIGVTRQAARENGREDATEVVGKRSEYAFHISVGWLLEEPTSEAKEATRSINVQTHEGRNVSFDRVHIKIGNNIQDVILS